MWQDLAIVFCGVWVVGGLFLALVSRMARIMGIAAVIGGLVGLAICLSY